MRNTVTTLLVILLPVLVFSQSFRAPDLSSEKNAQFFAATLYRQSPVIQRLYASAAVKTDMKPEEARDLINSKLASLNDRELSALYDKLTPAQLTRVGIILYLLMNGLSNTGNNYGDNYKARIGGGVGVFLMYTLAQFVLLPELSLLWRSYGLEYNGNKDAAHFTYLTLAFTVMYIIQADAINFLVGLCPNLGFGLSGKYKYSDGEKENIHFGDNGASRINFGVALTAGILMQNAMMLRLIYNIGLSKLYKSADFRMYYFAVALTIPLLTLK